MRSLVLVLISALLIGCGSSGSSGGSSSGGSPAGGAASGGISSGGTPSGGASSGGTASGGTASGGTASGGTSAGGTSTGGSAGAASGGGGAAGSGGEAGACQPTQGTVECGSEVCDLKTQYCCGGIEFGKCFAIGAFCGAGGQVEQYCDDTSDCESGKICCEAKNDGSLSDAQWVIECREPIKGPGIGPYGCGDSAGGIPWPAFCQCSSDCTFGSCKPSTALFLQGTYSICQ